MPDSYVTYTADGSTNPIYNITFNYMAEEDISVTVDGVAATISGFPSSSQVQVSGTPANGAEVIVRRTTTSGSAEVTFSDPAVLPAADLNNAIIQSRYLAEEAKDDADDAVTFAQGLQIDSGNLPSVTSGQANHLLTVDTNLAWVVTTPADTRTALQLGTAALLDAGLDTADVVVWGLLGSVATLDTGTGAGEVPTNGDLGTASLVDTGTAASKVPLNSDLGTAAYLDVGTTASKVVQLNGSAQIPAVDGSLLTGVVPADGTVDADKLSGLGQIVTGTYTGDGGSSNAVAIGFQPTMVMVYDPVNSAPYFAAASSTNLRTGGGAAIASAISFTGTGFTITSTNADINGSGRTYHYIAIKQVV